MSLSRYTAAMVLAGVGDALGSYNGKWESCLSGESIHKELKDMGGLQAIHVKLPKFKVTDDTILHLATARGLIKSEGMALDEAMNVFADEYIKVMDHMDGRSPGVGTPKALSALAGKRLNDSKAFRTPFNKRSGGCGASMRAMCIGLRYPRDHDLDKLIEMSIETSRITHHHPTGYLGGVVSALFTAFAISSRPPREWGADLMNRVLPKAKEYIIKTGVEVKPSLEEWPYFENAWSSYLKLRGIESGTAEPMFPAAFGVLERDAFYKDISYHGWGGASGHDSI